MPRSPLMAGLRNLAPRESKEYVRYTPQPFRAGFPATTEWGIERAVKNGFKASTWVYRCVTMVMESGSTVPFGIQNLDAKSEKWSFDWAHDISKVLAYWNDDFSPQESIAMELSWLLLGGNAIVGKYTGGFGPSTNVRELVAESPVGVRPIPNGLGGIERYQYFEQGMPKSWDAGDVCHGRLSNPENRFWGLSRLVALAKAIDTDVQAVDWNKRRLEMGGVPDGILVDKSITNPDQRAQAQAEIDETWRDIAGPFVTGDGIDWIQLGLAQKDLEFLAGRQFTMREICIGFGFNPSLFGENATFNNTEQAERSKWTGAIIPLLNILAQMFTRGLVPKARRGNQRVGYDLSGVEALHEDLGKSVESLGKMVQCGTPYDDAKDFLGMSLPDLPGGQGKVPLVDGRFITLRSLLEQETILAEDATTTAADPGTPPKPGTPPPAPSVPPPAVTK